MAIIGAVNLLLKERKSKIYDNQVISGMDKKAYWGANLCFDVLKLYIIFLMIYLINLWISFPVPYLPLFMAIGPLPIVAYFYVVSLLFRRKTTLNSIVMIFNFLVFGIGPFISLNPSSDEDFVNLGYIIVWILRFLPPYCFIEGIINIVLIEYIAYFDNLDYLPHPLSFTVSGVNLLILCLHAVVWPMVLGYFQVKS